MASNPDVSKLIGYAGTFQKKLITQMMNGLQVVQDCTLRANIKVQENLTKMVVGGELKQYDGVRDNKGTIAYEPRAIQVHLAQYDLDINTIEARKTWMSEVMKPGVNPTDVPFEALTFQKVTEHVSSKINDDTAWGGVRTAGVKTAAALADGFGTIIKKEILAGAIEPVITGSMLTDTVAKMEAIYKSLPERQRKQQMTVYVAQNVYDAYCEDYSTRFNQSPIYDKFGQTVLRHSEGKAILKVASWMAGSQRVVITPKSNLIVGTDALSDLNRILTKEQLYHVECGIVFAVGFQIEDLEPLAVNDQE
ncbi:hypothetical protein [Hymenobacter sp. BT190]|uniref:hypothetical protein n=1 Tax=Hymenobacter sp. BT190 TaxID=2763505 RepID=UPI001651A963|nr:hypothetical protein [Hymenobacter sp. BT190]MBC6698067.1 hypothetical protein [Hymenobacter sp. BT190]